MKILYFQLVWIVILVPLIVIGNVVKLLSSALNSAKAKKLFINCTTFIGIIVLDIERVTQLRITLFFNTVLII
jgi:hypothetical protein